MSKYQWDQTCVQIGLRHRVADGCLLIIFYCISVLPADLFYCKRILSAFTTAHNCIKTFFHFPVFFNVIWFTVSSEDVNVVPKHIEVEISWLYFSNILSLSVNNDIQKRERICLSGNMAPVYQTLLCHNLQRHNFRTDNHKYMKHRLASSIKNSYGRKQIFLFKFFKMLS